MHHPASAALRPEFVNAPRRQEAPPHGCRAEEMDCIWKKYRDWTSDQWKSVMFSDESMFRLVRGTSKTIRRPSGSDRYDPKKFTVNTVNPPYQVMVWGLSAAKGVVGDCISFLLMWPWRGVIMWMLWKIICSSSLTCIAAVFFMHDGALAHKTITVREFLTSHNIPVLELARQFTWS